jgi:hypothetical protein
VVARIKALLLGFKVWLLEVASLAEGMRVEFGADMYDIAVVIWW